MNKNINHKNYYDAVEPIEDSIKPIVVEKEIQVNENVDEPIVIKEVVEVDITSEDELYKLVKAEQVELLQKLGLSKTAINKLRLEKQRVDKILELIE